MAIFDVTLDSGRLVEAEAIHINPIYFNLLEGYPDRTDSDSLLAVLPDEAQKRLFRWPVHIIEPQREVGEPRGPRGRIPEWLPAYWIAAALTSSPIEAGDMSQAIVVWFQSKVLPFPSDSILRDLRGIDWNSFARDFCW